MNPRDAMFENIRRQVKEKLTQNAVVRFENAKRYLIQATMDHPISRELDSGLGATNLPYGTLRGFFGFSDGSSAVNALINFLEDNVTIEQGVSSNKRGLINMYIRLPSKKDFNDNLKCDWEDPPEQSWVTLVEDGISNLENYLYSTKRELGRSREGIQVKGVVKEGSEFNGVAYMSEIISNFRRIVVQGK